MPQGKGTYGSQVGRPSKKRTSFVNDNGWNNKGDNSSMLTKAPKETSMAIAGRRVAERQWRNEEWSEFMTDMPKGYRTKEEIGAKRKDLISRSKLESDRKHYASVPTQAQLFKPKK